MFRFSKQAMRDGKLPLVALVLSGTLFACQAPDQQSRSSTEAEAEKAASKPAESNSPYLPFNVDIKGINVGKTATPEEIAGWDIDVRPDGHGLPEGSGTPAQGEELYDEKCASCHGTFGEGEGAWPKLSGGIGTIKTNSPERTVGSYWPYASTLLDYVHRAMPFQSPHSLSWDEAWAISAYVLYLNEIITDEDFVFSKETFADVRMPNEGGFIPDMRPDTPQERCMQDCRDPAEMEIKVALLGYCSGAEDCVGEAENSGQQEGASADATGKKVYETACKLCHEGGLGGAPKQGDADEWKRRAEKGMDALVKNAIEGFQGETGVMPPKGGQMQLSDEEVAAAVQFMVEQSL